MSHNFAHVPEAGVRELKRKSHGLAGTHPAEKDGAQVTVDMFGAVRAVEELSGEKLMCPRLPGAAPPQGAPGRPLAESLRLPREENDALRRRIETLESRLSGAPPAQAMRYSEINVCLLPAGFCETFRIGPNSCPFFPIEPLTARGTSVQYPENADCE